MAKRALFLSLIVAMLVVAGAFADTVQSNATVSNVLPLQPTTAEGSQLYVHSLSIPSYAYTRGTDSNGDTVKTIFDVGTAGYGSVQCVDDAYETAWQTQGSAANLNTVTVVPSFCTYAYNLGAGANVTVNYSYSMRMIDDQSGENTTYPLNFSVQLYNSQPSAPSALNVSEGTPAPVAPPTVSFTGGTDVDTGPADTVTQRAQVGTTSGASDVMSLTQVAPAGFAISGAGLYGPGTNQNTTTKSQTRYYVRIFAYDGTAAGNANSSNYDTSFNITNDRPNVTGTVNNASSQPTAVAVGQKVRFTVNYSDPNTAIDTGTFTLRICSSDSATPTGCSGYQFCTNTTTGAASFLYCDYTTQNSDTNSNTTYAYIWDPRSLPTDASNTTASTFYVDQGISFTETMFGEEGVYDSFVIGNNVTCNATITSGDGIVKDVRFVVFGPSGSFNDPDFESANVSSSCTGSDWGTGRNCSATFRFWTNGTTFSGGDCRAVKGTWTCIVNATNAFDVVKNSGSITDAMDNTGPSVSGSLTGIGSNTITLQSSGWTGYFVNGTYSEPDGYSDVSTSSCASDACRVYCSSASASNSTSAQGWWNFSVRNFTDGTDGFVTASGCSSGGLGTRVIGVAVPFEPQSTNGTWQCRLRVSDITNAYAWSSSDTAFTMNRNSAQISSFDSASAAQNPLRYVFSGTPGSKYAAQIPASNGAYAFHRHLGNGYTTLMFAIKNFTRGADGTHLIVSTNFTMNASTVNTVDCSGGSAGCLIINNTYTNLPSGTYFQDPIYNYTAGGNVRYTASALSIPTGTLSGSYNTTGEITGCDTALDVCVFGGIGDLP